jgi:hypothetical protein
VRKRPCEDDGSAGQSCDLCLQSASSSNDYRNGRECRASGSLGGHVFTRMNLQYMVSGNEVTRDEFEKSSSRAAAAAAEDLGSKFSDVRCPTHGTPATVIAEANPLGVRIAKGCCDEMQGLLKSRAMELGTQSRFTVRKLDR